MRPGGPSPLGVWRGPEVPPGLLSPASSRTATCPVLVLKGSRWLTESKAPREGLANPVQGSWYNPLGLAVSIVDPADNAGGLFRLLGQA